MYELSTLSPMDVMVIISTAVVTFLGILATPIFFAVKGKNNAEQKGESPLWGAVIYGLFGYIMGVAFVAFFHIGVQVLHLNPRGATCYFFHGFDYSKCTKYGKLFIGE